MSSKLNVKAPKKDRPKSSDKLKNKKRDGTPDKPTTPNELTEELAPPTRTVIMNPEIERMAIKEDDLKKVHEPRPPNERRKSPTIQPVLVRKIQPVSEVLKSTPRMVTVARPAPPGAILKPLDGGGVGPRFDANGIVIPHSILGSLEDYRNEARRRGDPSGDFEIPDQYRVSTPTVKFDKKAKELTRPKYESVDETNALRNWQNKMLERKRQQGYISKLLERPPASLLMNHGDQYRKIQEERYLIDRTIPAKDYGKGYRVGSEFWKQQERIGQELGGVHMTMSQTEKGFPPPIEHIGVPKTIKQEKGVQWSSPATPVHYPWDKSQYLKQRQKQLSDVMQELDPHKPDINRLVITGSNQPGSMETNNNTTTKDMHFEDEESELDMDENLDPLRDHPDVVSDPIFGPSVSFDGKPARWTGDSYSFQGQVALEARITFEAYAGKRITEFLEVKNDGTTAIYYNWKRLPKNNPFDIVNAKVQRFYFNTSNGVILPGDTMKFPFVFKSPNAGVFTEQWQFETKPVVCGGAALVVTLRGVSLQEDKFKHQRTEIEKELALKQAENVVKQVLGDLIDGIKTPERSRSPVDAYITKEDVFQRLNPGMHWSNETAKELQLLYQALTTVEDEEPQEWDLSVTNLKEMIMDMEEDDDRKEEFLQRMNTAVVSLSFPPFTPMQKQMYNVGYQMVLEAVDQMVGQSMLIRSVMGLPEKDQNSMPDTDASGKGKPADKDKKDAKDKKVAKPDPKAVKGKESAKDSPKGGKTSPLKKPSSRQGMINTPVSAKEEAPSERAVTPGSTVQSPAPDSDHASDVKYREKLYIQTYGIINDMVDKMTVVFEDIRMKEDAESLQKLGLT